MLVINTSRGRSFAGRDLRSASLADLCQAEVQNLGMTAVSYENVCRLDVPMDDAARMCRLKGVSDLNRQSHDLIDIQGMVADQMLQSLSFQILHYDERSAVVLPNVVDGADIGVIETGSGLGLAPEAAERLLVSGDVLGKELERDEAAEAGVCSLED